MKFQYIGAGEDPPKSIVFMGYPFTLKHKYVEVSDEVAEKLKNHRCFQVEQPTEKPKKEKKGKRGNKGKG